MRESYSTDIIREKISGKPFLISGESLRYEGKHGIPPSMIIIAAILTFIPPFIFGALLITFLIFDRKHSVTWVTNKRLIDFNKMPLSKQYFMISVPLEQITNVRRTPLDSGNLIIRPIERVLGIDDLQVFVKDSHWVQCSITDIKKPKTLIKEIEAAKTHLISST